MSTVAVTIWSGLVLGSIYALTAIGFTISMLPTGVFNFAQGAIVVVGSFAAYQLLSVWKVPAGWAVLLAALAGAIVGLLCEVLTVRSLRWARGSMNYAMVTTVGAATVITGVLGARWGYIPLQVPFPGPSGYVRLLGVSARPIELIVFGAAIVSGLALAAFFRYTRVGQACLAVAEDRDPAMLRGVNVSALSLAAFAAAGCFGALVGFIIGPITYAVPTLGATLALAGFVAVALGGEGSFIGGLLGGLVVGLVETFATRYLGADYSAIAVLVLLLVTLTVKPKGLGGFAKARSV